MVTMITPAYSKSRAKQLTCRHFYMPDPIEGASPPALGGFICDLCYKWRRATPAEHRAFNFGREVARA